MNQQVPPERMHLIQENIGLAYHLARKHSQWEQPNGMSVEDREGEALLALSEAARTWEEGKAPFAAYAAKTIKNKLIQATRNEVQPWNMTWKTHTILRDMRRAVASGVEDTPRAISKELKMNISKVEELWPYHKGAKVPLTDAVAETYQDDNYSVSESVEALMEREDVARAIQALPPKHRQLIRYRFGFETGEPMLSSEIRKRMGLPKGQYLAMESASLRALQKLLASQKEE